MLDKNDTVIKEGDILLFLDEMILKVTDSKENRYETKSGTYLLNEYVNEKDVKIIGNMKNDPELFLHLNEKEQKELEKINQVRNAINEALK